MNLSDLKIKGNLNEMLGNLKQKYGQLTDDDVKYEEGKEDELFGRLQKKLGKSKEEILGLFQGESGGSDLFNKGGSIFK
jgi:uncharacterized protein YjbJ (UPF0337 family)